jgi:hypothetical protein
MELQTLRAAGNLTALALRQLYWKSTKFALQNSVKFAHRLAALSERDQVDLMTSSDDVYRDLADPWNLDDFDSRAALFEFIVSPSAAVLEAHKVHEAKGRMVDSANPMQPVL